MSFAVSSYASSSLSSAPVHFAHAALLSKDVSALVCRIELKLFNQNEQYSILWGFGVLGNFIFIRYVCNVI